MSEILEARVKALESKVVELEFICAKAAERLGIVKEEESENASQEGK